MNTLQVHDTHFSLILQPSSLTQPLAGHMLTLAKMDGASFPGDLLFSSHPHIHPSHPSFLLPYISSHPSSFFYSLILDVTEEKQLRMKVKEILSQHNTVMPSLVHGDLWSGNQAHCSNGDPVIYDPATYYGDREVDIAMTKLFGSNSNKFYEAYNAGLLIVFGH